MQNSITRVDVLSKILCTIVLGAILYITLASTAQAERIKTVAQCAAQTDCYERECKNVVDKAYRLCLEYCNRTNPCPQK